MQYIEKRLATTAAELSMPQLKLLARFADFLVETKQQPEKTPC